MSLADRTDRLVPGPGSTLDLLTERLQSRLLAVTDRPPLKRVVSLVSGERWLGHPTHPAIVMVPGGAWTISALYDLRGAGQDDPELDRVADAMLNIGLAAAVPAALTGIAQFLRTDGLARRIAGIHWALNLTAVGLYSTSSVLRRRGSRTARRRVAAAALALVGPGAYLGSHLAYRLGVGSTPPAAGQGRA